MARTTYNPGYVYVAHSALNGLYKIGLSIDPHKRIKSLRRVSNDESISLCLMINTNCMATMEYYLHRVFRSHRRHGEWFSLCNWDIAQIALVDDTHIIAEGAEIFPSNPPNRNDTQFIRLSNEEHCEMETNRLVGKVAFIIPPYYSDKRTPKTKSALILGKCAGIKIIEQGAMIVESSGEIFRISRNKLRIVSSPTPSPNDIEANQ